MSQSNPRQPNPKPRNVIYAIMAAVLIWGFILAIGVFLKTESWLAFAIVVSCTVVFVGIWTALLGGR
jgi:hypothetical protein